MYEDEKSISAFLTNSSDEVVEKIRFLSDYENLLNYINFFTLNPDYVEASDYLDKFQRLKVISINKYFKYLSNSINKLLTDFEGIDNPNEFFNFIMNLRPLIVDKKYYHFPKNYEKIRNALNFFEEKSKDCPDLKCTCDKLKYNFIDLRCNYMKRFYDKIFNEMINNYKVKRDTKKYFSGIFEVFKITICEIFYFMEFFQTKVIDNTFMLQNHMSYVYESLYSTLRPIIVHSHSIDELIILFNCISNYFSIFFVEENHENISKIYSDENKDNLDEENGNFQKRLFDIFNSLINDEVNIFSMPSGETSNLNVDLNQGKSSNYSTVNLANEMTNNHIDYSKNLIIHFSTFKSNFNKINELIQLAKILIRPNLIKIVQDIQEKIFLKISLHVKSNLLEIDHDLQYISKYEEVLNSSYENFSLFHFFLRKLSVLLELLRNIVSKNVLNDIAILAIEKFIQILNEEILNKKALSYEFEFYIIQQLILSIKLLNEFEVEAIENDIEIDIFSITDAFRKNFNNIFYENNLSIKDMIINSAPKIYEGTRDFKKILFNNLLKSYKILINIVNCNIFGKEIIDLIFKIRNREIIEDKLFEDVIGRNYDLLSDIYMKFDSILNEIKNQIFIVDENIAEKLSGMIMDNCYSILKVIKDELKKKLEFLEKNNLLSNKGNELFGDNDINTDDNNVTSKTKIINPYFLIYQKLVDFIEGELLNLNMKNIRINIFK